MLPVVALSVVVVVVCASTVGLVSVVMLPAVVLSEALFNIVASTCATVEVPLALSVVNAPVLALALPIAVPSTVPPLMSAVVATKPFVVKFVPSYVRLVLSSNAPFTPAKTTLSFVKSLTASVLAITSPVPLGVSAILPFDTLTISLPFTSKSPPS